MQDSPGARVNGCRVILRGMAIVAFADGGMPDEVLRQLILRGKGRHLRQQDKPRPRIHKIFRHAYQGVTADIQHKKCNFIVWTFNG